MPKLWEMAQISRPFQIALVALVLVLGVWFVAFRGHSSSSSGSESTASASSTSSPPPSSSAAHKPGGSSSVYHGPAPGVEGLSRAIAKAHGAVATSQQNATQLQAKSAQASGESTAAASSSSRATPAGSSPASTSSRAGTPASARTAQGNATAEAAARAKASEARSGPHRIPARQVLVERALHEGKIAVILFWNKKGSDDRAVKEELRLLEGVHHLIKPVAKVPSVRRALQRSGLEWQKPFAAFAVTANEVTSFGTITRGVQVYSTPTILIVNQRGQVNTITGLTDYYAIEQAIDEARHS